MQYLDTVSRKRRTHSHKNHFARNHRLIEKILTIWKKNFTSWGKRVNYFKIVTIGKEEINSKKWFGKFKNDLANDNNGCKLYFRTSCKYLK